MEISLPETCKTSTHMSCTPFLLIPLLYLTIPTFCKRRATFENMADTTPTIIRTSVSKIPMRSASTRKPASYNKSVRRYDLKYRGPSTPGTSSTTSARWPTLTLSTPGNASPDVQKKAIRDIHQLKSNTLKTCPPGPAASRSTPQPTTSDAPATRTFKLAESYRRALPASTFTPPPEVHTPERVTNADDTYTPPDPLLQRTQSRLHAELEILMQSLHLRLQTAPDLSSSYVQAFERLAADTLYEGMGERMCADMEQRRPGAGAKRKQSAGTLEKHLLREAARNTRRYRRGLNFFAEHDAKSTMTEVRRLQSSEDEGLTTSSLTDEEEEWLRGAECEYERGLASIQYNCQTCTSDMAQLIAEY